MDIMQYRKLALEETLLGLQQTGEPLVAVRQNQFETAGFTDTPGSYYFIPKIAHLLNISIDSAITLFYGSLILIAFLTAFWWIYKSLRFSKSLIYPVVLLMIISIVALVIGDVYTATFFAVFTLIPMLFISFSREKLWQKLVLFFLIGIGIGFSNFVRSHAGTVILFFALPSLALNKTVAIRSKIYLTLGLIAGILIFNVWVNSLLLQRNQFLASKGINTQQLDNHPFWHSVYIGLGYLDNNYGIKYNDEVARAKVASVDRTVDYCSQQYEKILKNEYFKLIKNDPGFFIETILAKSGVLILMFLIFTNVGFYFIFKNLNDIISLIPFGLSLGFSSMQGILVMPRFSYIIGFLSLTVLMSVFYYMRGYKKQV